MTSRSQDTGFVKTLVGKSNNSLEKEPNNIKGMSELRSKMKKASHMANDG